MQSNLYYFVLFRALNPEIIMIKLYLKWRQIQITMQDKFESKCHRVLIIVHAYRS